MGATSEQIIYDPGMRAWLDVKERRRPAVRNDGVIPNIQFRVWIYHPFNTVFDQGGVLGITPFLYHVTDHITQSTVGHIDGIAAIALAIHDIVILNVISLRAGLD